MFLPNAGKGRCCFRLSFVDALGFCNQCFCFLSCNLFVVRFGFGFCSTVVDFNGREDIFQDRLCVLSGMLHYFAVKLLIV